MARTGQYRERIAFEYQAPATDDGYGNEVAASWTTGCTVAARIKPLRGGETVQAQRLSGKQPTLITVRVSGDTIQITTDWRARDVRSGAIYNIRSKVNPDERKAEFDMECEMGVAV